MPTVPKNHRRAPEPLPAWTKLLVVAIIPIITFFGGMVMNAWSIADKIATKPYVDDRFIAANKYTDDQTARMLEKSLEHSDKNRAEMVTQMANINSALQVSQADIKAKVDLLLSMMSDQFKGRTHR